MSAWFKPSTMAQNAMLRVNGKLGQPFDVQVGLHQRSVLSPLLFIIVLEALSKELRTGSPWELLYADNLVIVSDSLADLQRKFDAWKSGMEDKGLRVNVGKTKLMVSGPNLNLIHDSGQTPMRGVRTRSLWQLNILWELQALGALALYRQTRKSQG